MCSKSIYNNTEVFRLTERRSEGTSINKVRKGVRRMYRLEKQLGVG